MLDAGPSSGDPFEAEVTIEFFRFTSADGTFAVAEATLDDGTAMPLAGALGHLAEDERALVRGAVEHHPRHGLQITVAEAQPLDPAGAEGARRYLRSLPGIGPKRADELVAEHGEDVFDVIDADPVAVFAALRGVGVKSAERAADEWAERRMERRLYTLLAPHGLSRHVGEVVALHGSAAAELVIEDPYSLTAISGIGFHSADRLAVANGVDPNSRSRTRAAAVHALREAENHGHTHLPRAELVAAIRELLGTEPALPHLEDDDAIVVEDGRYYREWTWRAERWLAATLAGMAAAEPAWSKPPIEGEAPGLNWQQVAAVKNALTRRLSVITGGPGTGKTHLTHALVLMAETRRLKIRLVAPTGRAARRLTEATEGAPATTIHKALEWIPGELPGRDEDAPIEADLVIVDEASMLSLEICRHLVAAIGPDTHLVLIGDVDQLPPVGPGKPFCELIDSGLAPTVRLDYVFRQARRSMIVRAAHAIRAGEQPPHDPNNDPALIEVQDFFRHSRSSPAALADDVIRIATERIPERFELDPVRDVQVLCPMNRGGLGARSLNIELQKALNPPGEVRVERFGWTFGRGDKVMQVANDHPREVYNGDLGIVRRISLEDGELVVDFEGRDIAYGFGELDEIVLAYATTVHKSQGSEYPAVVIPVTTQHYPMLQRNLIYTAVTRGKRLVVLVGQKKALSIAVRGQQTRRRWSKLKEWLAPKRG